MALSLPLDFAIALPLSGNSSERRTIAQSQNANVNLRQFCDVQTQAVACLSVFLFLAFTPFSLPIRKVGFRTPLCSCGE